MTVESYVYKKEVDWSLFRDGLAIPIEYQVVFKQISGRFLQRGESKEITLFLNGKSYTAKLNNYNIDPKYGNRKDVVQIRYSHNSDIAVALRGIFYKSYQYIKAKKELQESGIKQHIRLPEEYKEYLAIYTTEYDDTYLLETICADDIEEMKDAVQGVSEQLLESDINYKDDTAGIKLSDKVIKIRKLNRLIGENLKVLYGYRCQICGQYIGEEYGAHVAEAHHIDYFVKSLNNDSSNQMIVCPNHHKIIHATDPVFDRYKLKYKYPNGYEQGLLLNIHLKG